MKNQQGAPEALVTAAQAVVEADDKQALNQNLIERLRAALVEAQQPAAHVQNPAEIEHVAGDVSKNGLESNMAQQPAPSAAADLHPKTADLVQRFTAALADKLAAAEKKYGYSDGWASPDWMDECRLCLREHLFKGDPRDVAAYCAFLWHHGESTALPSEVVEDRVKEFEQLFPARKSSTPQADSQPAPIGMVLHCPKCGTQHIDMPEDCPDSPGRCECRRPHWKNPPHRSHLCHGCGHIWRPADVPTNGVAAVKTKGTADSPVAARKQGGA